LKIIQKESVVA